MMFNQNGEVTLESVLEDNAKLNEAINLFFMVDPDKGSCWEYSREQAERMAKDILRAQEFVNG
jgi:hypothetical protein